LVKTARITNAEGHGVLEPTRAIMAMTATATMAVNHRRRPFSWSVIGSAYPR
jgi:hypothetical protein